MVVISQYHVEIMFKLVLATFLGSLVGLEREIKRKPAGLRTHSIVTLGACLFTLVGLGLVGNSSTDTSRIVQGIVTGIGFLGAGTIFQSKEKVRGLTTAAELWTLASIGILVGIGSYFIAIVAAILLLVVLVPFKWFEKGIDTK